MWPTDKYWPIEFFCEHTIFDNRTNVIICISNTTIRPVIKSHPKVFCFFKSGENTAYFQVESPFPLGCLIVRGVRRNWRRTRRIRTGCRRTRIVWFYRFQIEVER